MEAFLFRAQRMGFEPDRVRPVSGGGGGQKMAKMSTVTNFVTAFSMLRGVYPTSKRQSNALIEHVSYHVTGHM